MEILRSNFKSIMIISLLVIGLLTVVFLVQKQQTIKSKADAEINTVLRITDDNGNSAQYNGDNTFTTNSNEVTISIQE